MHAGHNQTFPTAKHKFMNPYCIMARNLSTSCILILSSDDDVVVEDNSTCTDGNLIRIIVRRFKCDDKISKLRESSASLMCLLNCFNNSYVPKLDDSTRKTLGSNL